MSRYVQRNEKGEIVGDFANPQEFTEEEMEEDHPDFLEWQERIKNMNGKKVEVKSNGPTEI